MKKRVLSCVLVCLLVLSLCPMQVNADETAFRNAIADFMDNSVDEEGLYKWSFIICTLKAEGYSDAAIAGFLGCWKCESGNTVYAVEACGSREWTRIGDSSGTKYKYSEFVPGCAYQYGSNSTSWDSNKDSSGNHLPATPAPGRWTAGNGLGIAQWTAEREDRMTTFVETEGLPSSRYVTVSRWDKSGPCLRPCGKPPLQKDRPHRTYPYYLQSPEASQKFPCFRRQTVSAASLNLPFHT